MERPHREDGQQQMDKQAHHVGLQRRQKKRGTRWALTNSKDSRVTNGPEVRKTECCGKNLKKKTLTL